MSTRENLLAEIEAYLEARKMSATAFGCVATGDRTLVHSIRQGREPKASTIDRIRAYMARPTKLRRKGHQPRAAA